MTTEIAIMNKSAVALAADSAVTITGNTQQGITYKVLNSANKLFALSKYAPVGLMVYGNSSLMGIPWETIVKMYRDWIFDRTFKTLEDYCDSFFVFLDNFDISNETEKRYVLNNAISLFKKIRSDIDSWAKKKINMNEKLNPHQVQVKMEELVKIDYKNFLKYGEKSVLSKTKRQNLRNKFRTDIRKVSENIFENMHLSEEMHSNLLTIAINAASIGPVNQSGIVIAGFGTEELHPKCQNFDVAAIFSKKTIKRDGKLQSITQENEASVIPFAQSEDVNTFMEGIGPSLKTFLFNQFHNTMVNELPEKISDQIKHKLKLTDNQQEEVNIIVKDMCMGACDFAFKEMIRQQREKYINPVLLATSYLNKSELASMAETLVNLVSFRKQVSMEAETVGGPIDVAVISKGDGFVWIKRKHYFPAELNHHFFNNYYRKEKYNED